MSDKDPDKAATAAPQDIDDEGFLSRWSRLKDADRHGVVIDAEQDAVPAALAAEEAPIDATDAQPLTDADMPPLDTLTGDSDISGFLAEGVSQGLRRAALRKLFHSPKFNVCDGLDDYCEDFRTWAPLGSTITADMRHHMERLVKERLAQGGETEDGITTQELTDDPELAAEYSTDGGDAEALVDEEQEQRKVKDDGTNV